MAIRGKEDGQEYWTRPGNNATMSLIPAEFFSLVTSSVNNQDIGSLRQDYESTGIDVDSVADDPIQQFRLWFDQAMEANILEPNAMTLSTVDEAGWPSARVVLLKSLDEGCFSFFTNLQSDKATDLLANGRAALTFAWLDLHRQVRVTGLVGVADDQVADEYFQSRPRGSQIGAWASKQSQPVASRGELEEAWTIVAKRFDGHEVPRPPYWGGFRLDPHRIEFWQGRPNRMHDRIAYQWVDEHWKKQRLQP